MRDDTGFSEVGDRYGEQLARGLDLTGETAEYFARGRIDRMCEIIAGDNRPAGTILDFGCGTGASFALLRAAYPGARILGFEPAEGLQNLAARAATASRASLLDGDTLTLDREVDVVYCNGVFHHVPPQVRKTAMTSIRRALRGEGYVFAWENSPFNPGTRLVMSRVPFDRDAELLTPGAMRRLLATSGLAPRATEFHFVFPRALRMFRGLEPFMRALPFGGQYLVVGERRAGID